MATVVSVGNVTIGTNGLLTKTILDSIATLVATAGPGAVGSVQAGVSGTVSAPGTTVILDQSRGGATILGGASNQAIIGGDNINYSGSAGTIVAAGTIQGGASGAAGGHVADSTAGALFSFAGGNNTVTAGGASQTVLLDGGANWIWANASGQSITQSGGSNTVVAVASGSSAASVMASNGDLTFIGGFGTGNDIVSVTGSTTLRGIAGPNGTDTFMAGAGADTIFAVGGAVYHGGTGSDLFIGGAGTSTLYGASNETVWSGSGGGIYNMSANSSNFFAGGSGSDTVNLATGSSTTQVWSGNGETLSIGAAASASGALVVAFGQTTNIDMTGAAGNDTVVLWNAQIGAGAFSGNQTLTGSNAGHDVFVMFAASPFGAAAAGPHTIVINNWQASDIFDLSNGYSAADAQAATQALAAGSSFTLSDGTTVQFNGAKPTTIIHS
jgi:hypothetical protein